MDGESLGPPYTGPARSDEENDVQSRYSHVMKSFSKVEPKPLALPPVQWRKRATASTAGEAATQPNTAATATATATATTTTASTAAPSAAAGGDASKPSS